MLAIKQSPIDSLTSEDLANNYTKQELVNLIEETQHFNDKLVNSTLGAFVISLVLIYLIMRKLTNNKKETIFTAIGAIIIFSLIGVLLTDGLLNF